MALTDTTVVQLPRKRRRFSPRLARSPMLGGQRWAAVGCATVATVLLALSLAHLSAGIQMITHCSPWEGLALAIGIDAGLVAAEAAQLVAGTAAARAIRRWAAATIVGTLVASAALNAAAFGATADGLLFYAAVAFGCAVPAMIFALCRISVGLVSKH